MFMRNIDLVVFKYVFIIISRERLRGSRGGRKGLREKRGREWVQFATAD